MIWQIFFKSISVYIIPKDYEYFSRGPETLPEVTSCIKAISDAIRRSPNPEKLRVSIGFVKVTRELAKSLEKVQNLEIVKYENVRPPYSWVKTEPQNDNFNSISDLSEIIRFCKNLRVLKVDDPHVDIEQLNQLLESNQDTLKELNIGSFTAPNRITLDIIGNCFGLEKLQLDLTRNHKDFPNLSKL